MKLIAAGILAAITANAAAADLGSEIAAWGPLATGTTPIEDGLWFVNAVALETGSDRLDGLFVTRRHGGVDGEAVTGYAYDAAQDGKDYSWGRFYVRAGTDPLADRTTAAFATIGAAICLPLFVSVAGEIGKSSERGLLLSGEVALLILRIRAEHDDKVDTFRIGTGPRVLGTTGPFAWGIMLDSVTSHINQASNSRHIDSAMASAFGMWRPYNHLLVCGGVQAATRAVDRDDPSGSPRPVAEFSIGIGTTF